VRVASLSRPPLRKLALAVAAVVALAACGEAARVLSTAGMGLPPTLPLPRQTLFPTGVVAPITGWPGTVTRQAASGARADTLVRGADSPRWFYTLVNGNIPVAGSNAPRQPDNAQGITGWMMGLVIKGTGAGPRNASRVTLPRDSDADGVADQRSAMRRGLNSPVGMAPLGNAAYVANTDAILRFAYRSGDTQITDVSVLLTSVPAGLTNHHRTKNLIVSAGGSMLYVTVGSNRNVAGHGRAAEDGRAAIREVNFATGEKRLFTAGLCNTNGLAWAAPGGSLWTVVNERDEPGGDLVPDYLASIQDGAFYGWRWSYYGQHVDARVQPPRADMVARARVPECALGNHTASLGLAWSAGSTLAARFEQGMFMGQHGSWNRDPHSGYKVIFVPFAGGKPVGDALAVVTAFPSPVGKAYGRPVGVAPDKTDSLLVADDVGDVVWRVSASAPQCRYRSTNPVTATFKGIET